MRVAVGFFGMTRSLRHTAPSIHAHILDPLKQSGIPHRIYGHLHVPAVIDNPRTGEAGLPADPGDSALLPFDALREDAQDDSLVGPELAKAKAFPDILQDGYVSARNLCLQLRSLSLLWDMIRARETPDTWVLYLRPDLQYLDMIDIPRIAAAMARDGAGLAAAPWHGWGGLNDRFALTAPHAASAYARRGEHLDEHLRAHGGLHAETLLAHAMAQAKIRVTDLPVRALRIRAGGWAEARDLREFGLVDRWTIKSGLGLPATATGHAPRHAG